MKPQSVMVVALFGMLLILVAPAAFATYYGPEFQTPVSITPGSTISVVLTAGSGASIVPLPGTAGSYCTPGVSGNTETCIYPQQDWTTATACFYSVHSVTVTDPNGNGYMLGSAATSGLNFPPSLGGSVTGHGQAINITYGDSLTIPFGTGAFVPTYTSTVLGNPPNPGYGSASSPPSLEGGWYWWTVAGNSYGSNLRLDENPSINPTSTHGTYTVDIEGVVACPTTSSTFTDTLFFDAPITVITPQFSFSLAFVAATGFAALFLLRRKVLAPARTSVK